MVIGRHDILVAPHNSVKARNLLGKAVIDYIEIDGGHNIFMIGKDQSWFKETVMGHVMKYNPV